ncbi:MAG: hypothetical protein RIG61_04220 [Deltaproteobacteria bacterium]
MANDKEDKEKKKNKHHHEKKIEAKNKEKRELDLWDEIVDQTFPASDAIALY